MTEHSFAIIWEFQAKADRIADFERVYGPQGAWAQLFRRADGYLGTELLRDDKTPGSYLTIDRWTSEAAFDAFHAAWRKEYEALERDCEALMERETMVGTFDTALRPSPLEAP